MEILNEVFSLNFFLLLFLLFLMIIAKQGN